MKILLLLLCAVAAYPQADISSAVVRGVWNAGSATRTAPFKIGTSPPGTCTVGDQFWDSDATAGSNLFSCTATDTWVLQAGSGATAISGLTDLKVTKNSATDVVMAAGKMPCGSTAYDIAQTTFVHDTGTSSPVYVGIDCAAAGAVVLARGNNVMTSPTGYTSVIDSNFDNYPNIIPIASITVASNDWGTVTDLRTLGSWAGGIVAGSGITIDKDSNGLPRIATTGSGSGGIAPWVRGATMADRPTCDSSIEGQAYMADDSIGLTSLCFSAAWRDYYQNTRIVRPGVASGWTLLNGGTLTDVNGFPVLKKASAGLTVAVKAQADTAWTATLGFIMPFSASNGHECGIYATTGETLGTHLASGLQVGSSTSDGMLWLSRLYNPINGTVDNATAALARPGVPITGGVVWMRIARSGSTFTYYMGDGYGGDFTQIGSGDSLLAGTPTRLGFGCDARGTVGVQMKVIHWDVQ